jgi:hypothetical protein
VVAVVMVEVVMVAVVVMAVVVVSIPPHFEIPRKKIKKGLKNKSWFVDVLYMYLRNLKKYQVVVC